VRLMPIMPIMAIRAEMTVARATRTGKRRIPTVSPPDRLPARNE
jgi:hypothetical protein